MTGISSSPFSLALTPKTSRCCCYSSFNGLPCNPQNPRLSPKPCNLKTIGKGFNRTSGVQCNSSSGEHGPGSDENESKVVLDAFFLGKAFAEALNERIGSTVGEILSVVGQWQAEQQKQVQEFQEEVLERAKKAKEKAALDAMEDQGIISKSSTARTGSTTPGSTASVATSFSGPLSDDPLQEMLKD